MSFVKEAHPVLSLEAGIQAGAFIDFPDGQSGHRHLGNIGEAFKQSKHTILKNRSDSYAYFRDFSPRFSWSKYIEVSD